MRWGGEPRQDVLVLSFACFQHSQFREDTPSLPQRANLPEGAPVPVSDQMTHLEVVRVGGAHHAATLACPPLPAALKAERPRSGWGLTYVLAPGEGQGPVSCPSLLLSGWWLVAVVPSLLGRQHIHFRVGVLIWVFIIAVLQGQIPCSVPHACLGGTEGQESKAGRGRLTRVRQLLAAALGLKPGLLLQNVSPGLLSWGNAWTSNPKGG